jgi:hypothetical protein
MRSTSLLLTSIILLAGSIIAQPQPIQLQNIVLTAKHSEIINVPGAGPTSQIIRVRSGNPGVATAQLYRTSQIQVVAVAPGKTNVEFFNNTTKQMFVQPVWVEAANATGGGGAGYDPRKTQLPQVVMQANRTHNVTAPGPGSHQLSTVVSSNPAVATARANTTSTIQVYSVALGDTWVDFTDNATGTTYQVHVWVTATGALPDSTGGGSGGSAGGKKPPVAGPIVKGLDPCLVGEWVSETVTASDNEQGGSGVRLEIERSGRLTIDYTSMQPVVTRNSLNEITSTSVWTGIAAYQITPYTGGWNVKVVSNNITFRFSSGVEGKQDDYGGPGVALAPRFINCSGDQLTVKRASYRRVTN